MVSTCLQHANSMPYVYSKRTTEIYNLSKACLKCLQHANWGPAFRPQQICSMSTTYYILQHVKEKANNIYTCLHDICNMFKGCQNHSIKVPSHVKNKATEWLQYARAICQYYILICIQRVNNTNTYNCPTECHQHITNMPQYAKMLIPCLQNAVQQINSLLTACQQNDHIIKLFTVSLSLPSVGPRSVFRPQHTYARVPWLVGFCIVREQGGSL